MAGPPFDQPGLVELNGKRLQLSSQAEEYRHKSFRFEYRLVVKDSHGELKTLKFQCEATNGSCRFFLSDGDGIPCYHLLDERMVVVGDGRNPSIYELVRIRYHFKMKSLDHMGCESTFSRTANSSRIDLDLQSLIEEFLEEEHQYDFNDASGTVRFTTSGGSVRNVTLRRGANAGEFPLERLEVKNSAGEGFEILNIEIGNIALPSIVPVGDIHSQKLGTLQQLAEIVNPDRLLQFPERPAVASAGKLLRAGIKPFSKLSADEAATVRQGLKAIRSKENSTEVKKQIEELVGVFIHHAQGPATVFRRWGKPTFQYVSGSRTVRFLETSHGPELANDVIAELTAAAINPQTHDTNRFRAFYLLYYLELPSDKVAAVDAALRISQHKQHLAVWCAYKIRNRIATDADLQIIKDALKQKHAGDARQILLEALLSTGDFAEFEEPIYQILTDFDTIKPYRMVFLDAASRTAAGRRLLLKALKEPSDSLPTLQIIQAMQGRLRDQAPEIIRVAADAEIAELAKELALDTSQPLTSRIPAAQLVLSGRKDQEFERQFVSNVLKMPGNKEITELVPLLINAEIDMINYLPEIDNLMKSKDHVHRVIAGQLLGNYGPKNPTSEQLKEMRVRVEQLLQDSDATVVFRAEPLVERVQRQGVDLSKYESHVLAHVQSSTEPYQFGKLSFLLERVSSGAYSSPIPQDYKSDAGVKLVLSKFILKNMEQWRKEAAEWGANRAANKPPKVEPAIVE
ncbi:MAG: hypothetical protein SGJ20_02610 [Planctomycetota bacterium]|nr:hypothetical protein [Planctomycetota bacterium]